MNRRRKSITALARELRKNQTGSERKLWEHLRKKRLDGYRFLRQKPFIHKENNRQKYFFIADFYCPARKLVIELDGQVHNYQKYADHQRDIVLKQRGLLTVRFKNDELEDIEEVKRKILVHLK